MSQRERFVTRGRLHVVRRVAACALCLASLTAVGLAGCEDREPPGIDCRAHQACDASPSKGCPNGLSCWGVGCPTPICIDLHDACFQACVGSCNTEDSLPGGLVCADGAPPLVRP